MCAIPILDGKNRSYIRFNFYNKFQRLASRDTTSCAKDFPQSLFNGRKLNNTKLKTPEKPSYDSAPMPCGHGVPIDKKSKLSFHCGPHYFQGSFVILQQWRSLILETSSSKKLLSIGEQFAYDTEYNCSVESICIWTMHKKYFTEKRPKKLEFPQENFELHLRCKYLYNAASRKTLISGTFYRTRCSQWLIKTTNVALLLVLLVVQLMMPVIFEFQS